MKNTVRHVVILGGGTAGWISAAMLVQFLGADTRISLVESSRIGTIGVGEATIPTIKTLNSSLDLGEQHFIRQVDATFKLGIQFEGWGGKDSLYMHTFGEVGKDQSFCPFHHYVLRARLAGKDVDLWDYSLNYQAARRHLFAPVRSGPDMPAMDYAYHFDAALYANYLRDYAVSKGVERIDAVVESVRTDPESGHVTQLHLDNDDTLGGDLFIDCSGFRALLIEQTLGVKFIDWDHWLPCDRAVAVQSGKLASLPPYTRSIAHPGGWQWQIPLQSRTGNGLVYSSREYSDDQARAILESGIDGDATTDYNLIRFRVGVRERPWHKNVVAVGLSGGFLEPLESTSIHLVHSALLRLIWCFPHQGISRFEVDEFNRQVRHEWAQIRDFIIAHYHLNNRDDSELWRHCASMELSHELAHKISLYRETGKLLRECEALFGIPSWLQVLEGQGVRPGECHPIAAATALEEVDDMLARLRQSISRPIGAMPSHAQFIGMLA
ncbi:tryptophan 7-halogenase [Marinihelvus fidelis]|uniref:Tryptophan 7-halogenase n=1 Tax=Marinihelvus fidelis TaxID=2613842 RepID=A0A5N0TJ46_9GAMM|nr:tryptophan halogenase family protein [Marinihelvus fidelis]KAA9134127.1 tryptophan 7-halogenase [Marinihelvus fidelis]